MSLKIEVLSSPGCAKCVQARERLKSVILENFSNQLEWREVNIMEELDYAVKLGVLTTPAIAVNGKLIFKGLPSVKEMQAFLEKSMANS